MARLATLASVSVGHLEELAYRPADRFARHRFGSGLLDRNMLDLSMRRACPACLEQSPFHRQAWDLALLTACPDHGFRLVERCPRCRRRFGWTDAALDTCRCGFGVRQWPRTTVAACESRAGARLLQLASAADCGWLPEPLGDCDPAGLVRLAMSLGMFLAGWRRSRRPETLAKAGPDTVARVVVAGISTLQDWPGPLLAFLEAEGHRAGERSGRYGAAKMIGPFYGWLREVEPGPMKDALVCVVQRSVASDPAGAHRMHRSNLLSAATSREPAFVSLRQAAGMLGRSTTVAKRLLTDTRLPDGQPAGRGIPAALDREAVVSLVHREEGLLTLRDVARRLGVARDRTRRILEAGLIPVRNQASGSPGGRWAVERAAVDAFISRILGSSLPRPRERLGGFDYAVEAARRRGVDMVGLLRRVQEGTLRPAGLDDAAVGIRRLVFARHDILALGSASDGSRALTVQEAARRLGLKWQVVDHLARRGILDRSAQGIPAVAVERFSAGFVTGAEMARTRRTSPRALAASLARVGIVPVSGPGVDGGRQNFYARKALDITL